MGRPSGYNEVIADEICRRLALGESVREICTGSDMPSQSMVYRWLEQHGDFREQYAQARERQADAKFEKAWEIAEAATVDNVQVARLQVDTIKWQAAKLSPKKYGDKIDVNHSGEVVARHDLSGYSPDELDALEKLIAKASDGAGDPCGESPPGPDRVH